MQLLIEKGVEMPKRMSLVAEYDNVVEQLKLMQVGDSFTVVDQSGEYQRVSICIKRLRSQNPTLKYEFKSTRLDNKRRRFWRIK